MANVILFHSWGSAFFPLCLVFAAASTGAILCPRGSRGLVPAAGFAGLEELSGSWKKRALRDALRTLATPSWHEVVSLGQHYP